MGDKETVNMLKAHYEKNVLELPEKPNPRIEEFKEQLNGDPEGFRKLVVVGLNRYILIADKVAESDIDGTVFAFDSELSTISMKVQEEKLPSLMKKLGELETDLGGTLYRESFEGDSPLHGLNIIVFSSLASYRHEFSHVKSSERSAPRRNLRNVGSWLHRQISKEEYVKGACTSVELMGLSEILAYEGNMTERQAADYSGEYARIVAGMFCASGGWPKNGREALEAELADYFKVRFNVANAAFSVLREKLPSEEVEKIMMSCGPTRDELESGNYISPVEELVEWSRHYKEVLASE